jgi:hypothetical protein
VITLNEKVIATVACRVLSIYSIIKGLERSVYLITLPFLFEDIDKNALFSIIFIYVIPSITLIITAILLWVKASRISELIIPSSNESEINKIDLNIIELQSVAFSVVGLIVLVRLIPDTLDIIPQIKHLSGDNVPFRSIFKLEIVISIVETIIKLIIGLLLLFKSSGFVGMLRKTRT